MKKVGVIGSGTVGETLANGFLHQGLEVMRGSREPSKLDGWMQKAGAGASTGTFAATAAFGDVVVLAVKGTAAEEAVRLCGAGLASSWCSTPRTPSPTRRPRAGCCASSRP
jgi:8-hydroxy-5-deazaflavin:NADPH oxidoreductase